MAHKVSEQWFLKDKSKVNYRFFFNYQVTFYGEEFRGKFVCDMSKRCSWDSEHNDRNKFIEEFLEYFDKYRLSGSQHSVEVLNIYCKGVKTV